MEVSGSDNPLEVKSPRAGIRSEAGYSACRSRRSSTLMTGLISLPVLCSSERQDINSRLEKFRIFGERESLRESVCQCGWKKDHGDHN